MIKLDNSKALEGYGLFLQEDTLNITKTIEDYIVIDQSIVINVLSDVNAKIIDLSNNANINVNIDYNSSLQYQILYSKNNNRIFNNKGYLEITEIVLNETNEELLVNLLAEHSEVKTDFLTIANACNQSFVQTINHKNINTISNISNFGVALNSASIAFDTTGKIEKNMAKSICKQLSKGIIMDDNSHITSKPILLIDEYDVVANHGASIGKMSDESLFYLMSRGLNKEEAFLLILEGIIRPFIDKVFDQEYKEEINLKLRQLIKR